MTLHDQTHYPLATLVLVACERAAPQRARLLALAAREAARRAERGIPGL